MTVRDYLLVHTEESFDSVGIYLANPAEGESDILAVHTTPITIAPHLDRVIDHVHTWIYDDTIKNMFGETVPVKRIRACIYVN